MTLNLLGGSSRVTAAATDPASATLCVLSLTSSKNAVSAPPSDFISIFFFGETSMPSPDRIFVATRPVS
eukprot:CAMPEP_0194275714 /NCGR_PEP_ID=MMETSP0169-20130528/8494_1 /TAXON_ID=218684 /ORGANISM="Corethron pennatum, Strain L29A3" /LENGTH=68 /DNA_ID=CAMNT_0039019249 /DNA_START=276 /DNA_END=482 /DNA_ORIENTATION=+